MLDKLRLPSWCVQLRPHQVVAIHRIVRAFEEGDRVVILDAPTGSGKTLIAEAVRQVLRARALYVCTTKTLQNQFARDFPSASVIKGRNNYPTLTDDPDITAADCNKADFDNERCSWCWDVHHCPYEQAKAAALRNDLTCANTSYLLTEGNGPGKFRGRDLVIVDECDTLEAELMSYESVYVSPRRIKKYSLGEPERVTKPEAWAEWTKRSLEKVSRIKVRGDTIPAIRERKYVAGLKDNLARLQSGLEDGGWVYTGRNGEVSFKPVRVNNVGMRDVWSLGKRWLLMSASVVSPDEIVESLGCELPWTFVSIPSTFDPANRRIKVIPAANMGRNANERDKLASATAEILRRHPDDRVLIHAVSYELSAWLQRELLDVLPVHRPVYSYAVGRDREEALAAFRSSERSVLIAPSLDRGVDLPDDECRVVIVAKAPFPYLGDRQVSARLHSPGGDLWYKVQTIRTIVQMTGRATRSSTDFSTSYLLDKQIVNLYNGLGRRLFPAWWLESLDWRDRL